MHIKKEGRGRGSEGGRQVHIQIKTYHLKKNLLFWSKHNGATLKSISWNAHLFENFSKFVECYKTIEFHLLLHVLLCNYPQCLVALWVHCRDEAAWQITFRNRNWESPSIIKFAYCNCLLLIWSFIVNVIWPFKKTSYYMYVCMYV